MSSPAGQLFIGVDGGGTKTAFTVVSSSGQVLSALTLGSTNPNSVGEKGAIDTMSQGIAEVVKSAGGDLSSVRSIVLSISGCNSSADALRMQGWLSSSFPRAVAATEKPQELKEGQVLLTAYNDSIAALVSGTQGALEGVIVIAGTGMIVKAFNAGKEITAGGNGALIDGGSGYDIGLCVLKAAFAADSGIGPSTPLLNAALAFLKKERAEELVDWLYADRSWDRVASLVPLAFHYASTAAASNGQASLGPNTAPFPTTESEVDPVAKGIVQSGADYLVKCVKTASNRAGVESQAPVTVVCAGGILANPHMFRLMSEGVKQFLPNANLVHPKVSPSEGAALLALKQWKDVTKQ